jgi:hypothetical protein
MNIMNHVPKLVKNNVKKFWLLTISKYQKLVVLAWLPVQMDEYIAHTKQIATYNRTMIRMYLLVALSSFDSLDLALIEFFIIFVSWPV